MEGEEALRAARHLAAMNDDTAEDLMRMLTPEGAPLMALGLRTLLSDAGAEGAWQTFIVQSAIRRRLNFLARMEDTHADHEPHG